MTTNQGADRQWRGRGRTPRLPGSASSRPRRLGGLHLPEDGALVTLHPLAPWGWCAHDPAQDRSLAVRETQLSAFGTPPNRLILARDAGWQPEDRVLAPPVAHYRVQHHRHTLILHLLGAQEAP